MKYHPSVTNFLMDIISGGEKRYAVDTKGRRKNHRGQEKRQVILLQLHLQVSVDSAVKSALLNVCIIHDKIMTKGRKLNEFIRKNI